ncbi:hypothetical protein [Vibrio vulnificus YJ016]|uniref:Uncharacterized protein n=1 Tax=Vibrio vulnificus (strain YJ016) TaxID=196600 RepID=Q7MDM4_VIBVY|nr:hypothetical protein [Vibrio vulnificus YJ016]
MSVITKKKSQSIKNKKPPFSTVTSLAKKSSMKVSKSTLNSRTESISLFSTHKQSWLS